MKILIQRPLYIWLDVLLLFCFAFAKLGTWFCVKLGFLKGITQYSISDEIILVYAGAAEFIIGILIIWFLSVKRASQLIALIGCSFLAYRYFTFHVTCPCMGAAPALMPWLKVNERIILLVIPFIWLLTGLWGWAREVNLQST